MEYHLHKKLRISAAPDEVWNFFSSPGNLQKITPPYMNFRVLDCPDTNSISEGMLITYRVSPVLKLPLTWVTLIDTVKPGASFSDTQLNGPYKLWRHVHTFEEKDGAVIMTDDVTYALPLGPLGSLAHRLFVKKQLEDIFHYRETAIRKIFTVDDGHTH